MTSSRILLPGVLLMLVLGATALHSTNGAPTPGGGTTVNSSGPRPLLPAVPTLVPVAATLSTPAEWSTYLANPERTSANLLERTLAASNISLLRPLWNDSVSASVYASPAVVNGTVYVGSWDGYEYALNASTGHVDWKTNLGLSTSCYVGGIDSSATVWNGTVYVGGGDDHWYALNAINGSIEWSLNVLLYGSTTGNFDWVSPLLYHGFEYIGLASCSDSPLVQGKLLQVNLTGNHSVVHQFDAVPNGRVGVTIWETPAVDPATNTLWLATGNEGGPNQPYAESMVALNATNLSVLGHWEVPGVIGSDSDFGSGPTLFNDSSGRALVVAVNKDGSAYAFNRSNVTTNGSWGPIWVLSTGDTYAPSAFDGSRLFLAGGYFTASNHSTFTSSVYRVDPSNGAPVWHVGLAGSGTIVGGLWYANGLLFVPDGPDLEILNATTGALLKVFEIPSAASEVIDDTPAVVDGAVVFGSGNYASSGHIFGMGIPLGGSIDVAPANSTPPGELQFHGNASGGTPGYNFSWTFGDGSGGYGPSPAHLYEYAGPYTVNLSLRDAAGSIVNATTNVTVASDPAPLGVALLSTPASGTAPLLVTFNGSERNGAGAVQFQLAFGDGSPDVDAPNATHWYNVTGAFTATLVATDSWGRTADVQVTESIGTTLAVAADALPTSGTVPLNVTFTDVPSGGTPPYSVTWNFGDGSAPIGGLSVVHEYTTVGNFTVRDSLVDSAGTRSNHSFLIAVAGAVSVEPPAPLAAVAEVRSTGVDCATNSTGFEATATASGGTGPYTFTWSFADGSAPVTGPNATHSYRIPGMYGIELNVTDATGSTVFNLTVISVAPSGCLGALPMLAPAETINGWEIAAAIAAGAALVVLAIRYLRRRWAA